MIDKLSGFSFRLDDGRSLKVSAQLCVTRTFILCETTLRGVLAKVFKSNVLFENDISFFRRLTGTSIAPRLIGRGAARWRGSEFHVLFLQASYLDCLTLKLRDQNPSLLLSVAKSIIDTLANAQESLSGLILRRIDAETIFLGDHARIFDFSLASIEGQDPNVKSSLAEEDLKTRPKGSLAPEQIQRAAVDCKLDVWDLGQLLHRLCFGGQLFVPSKGAEQQMVLPERPQLPPLMRQLLLCCLKKESSSRPSISDLKYLIDEHMASVDSRVARTPSCQSRRSTLPSNILHKWFSFYSERNTKSSSLLQRLLENNETTYPDVLNALIRKAWLSRTKINKIYGLLCSEEFRSGSRTFVALKELMLLHSFWRYGPIEVFNSEKVARILWRIKESWKEILDGRRGDVDDQVRSPKATQFIIAYAEALGLKALLHQRHSDLLLGDYSIIIHPKPATQPKVDRISQLRTDIEDILSKVSQLAQAVRSLKKLEALRESLTRLLLRDFCDLTSFIWYVSASSIRIGQYGTVALLLKRTKEQLDDVISAFPPGTAKAEVVRLVRILRQQRRIFDLLDRGRAEYTSNTSVSLAITLLDVNKSFPNVEPPKFFLEKNFHIETPILDRFYFLEQRDVNDPVIFLEDGNIC
eukprot:TRINITY_DN4682_c0_g2_i1.p1 TRINITY_DN4682_c0_g2~~TRINITY_DN4682_c0_g2_i1.p1  ORF type:complete len:638 (-),score=76.26 TRINITY_DN4682_c0_g2_i1:238-2151(-)